MRIPHMPVRLDAIVTRAHPKSLRRYCGFVLVLSALIFIVPAFLWNGLKNDGSTACDVASEKHARNCHYTGRSFIHLEHPPCTLSDNSRCSCGSTSVPSLGFAICSCDGGTYIACASALEYSWTHAAYFGVSLALILASLTGLILGLWHKFSGRSITVSSSLP
jgi:hypothetical protein